METYRFVVDTAIFADCRWMIPIVTSSITSGVFLTILLFNGTHRHFSASTSFTWAGFLVLAFTIFTFMVLILLATLVKSAYLEQGKLRYTIILSTTVITVVMMCLATFVFSL